MYPRDTLLLKATVRRIDLTQRIIESNLRVAASADHLPWVRRGYVDAVAGLHVEFLESILDTVHSIACMHASYVSPSPYPSRFRRYPNGRVTRYFYLVTNYFKPTALLSGVWSVCGISLVALCPLTQRFEGPSR